MIRLVVLLNFYILFSPVVSARSDDTAPPVVFPSIAAQAKAKSDLVPKGWVIEKESRGDLNGDGVPDLLLVLHMTDPRNIITNNDLGTRELDTNPRMLVVAFADKIKNNYSLVLANHTLIPRHTDPVMADPFEGAGVVRGTVQVSLSIWMSAGSWSMSQTKLTFRYQDGCFKLIGHDFTETQRNSGETSTVSTNYLTRKQKIATGTIESDREKVTWKTIGKRNLLCLGAVGDGLEFNPVH